MSTSFETHEEAVNFVKDVFRSMGGVVLSDSEKEPDNFCNLYKNGEENCYRRQAGHANDPAAAAYQQAGYAKRQVSPREEHAHAKHHK